MAKAYPTHRRAHERAEAEHAIHYSDGNRMYSEFLRDISRGGIQIEAMKGLEPGTTITISLPATPPLKVTGLVRWTSRKGYRHRMGIEFINLTIEKEARLQEITESLFWELNPR